MSDQLSINDFEVWYRCWYSLKISIGYILEISVNDILKEGDTFAVYARPRSPRHLVSSKVDIENVDSIKLCLFKETLGKKIVQYLNDLIRVQQREYKLNFNDSVSVIIQKFILSYDFENSVNTGKVHSSLDYTAHDLLHSNNENIEYSENKSDKPLWSLKQFSKIYMLLLDEVASETIDYYPRRYRGLSHFIPPVKIFNKTEARILPDGTIEKYLPPVFANTPFLSFIVSFLCFHKDKSKIKKLIHNLLNDSSSRNSKNEKNWRTISGKKQYSLLEKRSSDTTVIEHKADSAVKHEEESNVFRHEGYYWMITFQGNKLPPIKDLKGLHYISFLSAYLKLILYSYPKPLKTVSI